MTTATHYRHCPQCNLKQHYPLKEVCDGCGYTWPGEKGEELRAWAYGSNPLERAVFARLIKALHLENGDCSRMDHVGIISFATGRIEKLEKDIQTVRADLRGTAIVAPACLLFGIYCGLML